MVKPLYVYTLVLAVDIHNATEPEFSVISTTWVLDKKIVPKIIREPCVERGRIRGGRERHGHVTLLPLIVTDGYKRDVPNLDKSPSQGSGPFVRY
jgi:hypothetical protein